MAAIRRVHPVFIARFLEHSRIFHFAAGQENPVEGDHFIGSGDWMVHNPSRTIEIATPIYARAAKKFLREILDACLSDHRQAWTLNSPLALPRNTL